MKNGRSRTKDLPFFMAPVPNGQDIPGGNTREDLASSKTGRNPSMKLWLATTIIATLLACTACAPSNNEPPKDSAKLAFQLENQNQGGTFTKGDWTYVLKIRNPGSRSEGSEGRLYYKNREVTIPQNPTDYFNTPLGIFRHTGVEAGQERLPWDATGWMLQNTYAPDAGGTALPWPQP